MQVGGQKRNKSLLFQLDFGSWGLDWGCSLAGFLQDEGNVLIPKTTRFRLKFSGETTLPVSSPTAQPWPNY